MVISSKRTSGQQGQLTGESQIGQHYEHGTRSACRDRTSSATDPCDADVACSS
jgi:hypothetical protein